jgi:uncharacterized protein
MENFQELLLERLQIFSSAALIFFLLLLVVWRNGYFSFPRIAPQAVLGLSNKILMAAFGIFLFLQLLFIPLTFEFWYYFYTLGEAHASHLSPELQGWVTVYGIWVTGLGMFLFYKALPEQVKEVIWGPFGFSGWKTKLQDFIIAFLTWLLSYPLVVAVGQVVAMVLLFAYQNVEPEQVAVKQIKTAATSNYLLTVLVFSVIFLVPVIEELLFRGFFQNWLKKFMGRWNAVALTSVVFAIFHFAPAQGMGNIELIVSLFVLSCFLGFIYERQKSIWAPISLHAIFNSFSLLLIFSKDSL